MRYSVQNITLVIIEMNDALQLRLENKPQPWQNGSRFLDSFFKLVSFFFSSGDRRSKYFNIKKVAWWNPWLHAAMECSNVPRKKCNAVWNSRNRNFLKFCHIWTGIRPIKHELLELNCARAIHHILRDKCRSVYQNNCMQLDFYSSIFFLIRSLVLDRIYENL